MRILYHHRTLADGAEGIHIAGMVEAFRSLGHDVHVRGLAGPARRATRLARVKALLPSSLFEVAAIGSNAYEYAGIRRAIRDIRPDFLYKRHARDDVGAIWAARQAGLPVVLEVNALFTAHEYQRFEPAVLARAAAALERRALTMASIVLAVSTPLARAIERVTRIPAVVMPNAADTGRFDPTRQAPERARRQLGLGTALTVGWAGVVREWHGLELLLDAVSRLPGARVLIIGDGPALPGIERRAAALGLGDRAVFTGRIPHDRMPEYLAAVDIAVVAHDGTGVASPMKLLEYMAMRRAVVAPRLDNIADIVTDGCDGLLFTPGDSGGLERTLRRLADDPALRVRLGEAARRTVEERFTWKANAERVLALVARRVEVLPRPRPSRASRLPIRRDMRHEVTRASVPRQMASRAQRSCGESR